MTGTGQAQPPIEDWLKWLAQRFSYAAGAAAACSTIISGLVYRENLTVFFFVVATFIASFLYLAWRSNRQRFRPFPSFQSSRRAVALVAVALAFTAYLGWAAYTAIASPDQLGGKVSVIVTPFIDLREGGEPSAESKILSANMTKLLRRAFPSEIANGTIVIDNKDTSVPDELAALALGDKFGASMVVYGAIELGRGGRPFVRPAFAITGQASPGLSIVDTAELWGESVLEDPIPLADSDVEASAQLSERAADVVAFMKGLVELVSGDHELATATFEGTAPGLLKESAVLHFFLGKALSLEPLDQWERAREEFESAIDKDSEYAKAYAGLGNMLYLGSINQAPRDEELLGKAAEAYRAALTKKGQPAGLIFEASVRINLGSALFELAKVGEVSSISDAREEFRLVIAMAGRCDGRPWWDIRSWGPWKSWFPLEDDGCAELAQLIFEAGTRLAVADRPLPTPLPTGPQPTPTSTGPTTTPEDAVKITMSSTSIRVGEEASVELLVSGLGSRVLGAWTISVSFPLNMVSVSGCESLSEAACNVIEDGEVRVAGAHGTGLAGDITLLTVTFTCESADSKPLEPGVEVFSDATTGAPMPIEFEVIEGRITCTEPQDTP